MDIHKLLDRFKSQPADADEPEVEREYRIIELHGAQLDRNATHLIVFDSNKITPANAKALMNNLHGNGIRATAVIADGDPGKAIHVYSIPEKQPDTINEPVTVVQTMNTNAATTAQRK